VVCTCRERRFVDDVRRVDQIHDSQIKEGRERFRKTIRETIRKYLEINKLNPNKVYDYSVI